ASAVIVHVRVLCAMPQAVIHERDRQHGLAHRHAADADAGIVTALGDHLDRISVDVDAAPRNADAGCRLEGDVHDDVLAGADAAQHSAGVIGEKAFRRDLVTMPAAALAHHVETVTDADGFHRVD